MLLNPFKLIARVADRFRTERSSQTAAALAFTTVMGFVPMIAGAVALASILPFGSGMGVAVQKFLQANLLPDKAGAIITKYVAQFARKAERLTWIGFMSLSVVALIQMLTIERTFNTIWRIRAPRPALRRLLMHVVALLLGPILLGASIVVVTYVATTSMGLVAEIGNGGLNFLVHSLPFLFTVALFSLLYWAVPNCDVTKLHAFIGGLFTATCMAAIQKLLSLYVANFGVQTVIYGAFAAIPVFLLWLYLAWTVVLLGAYIVAELPGVTPVKSQKRR